MKGVIFLGDRRATIKDFPEPEPGLGEVNVYYLAKSRQICRFTLEEAHNVTYFNVLHHNYFSFYNC